MRLELIELLKKANFKKVGNLVDISIPAYVDKLLHLAKINTIKKDNKIIGFIAYYDNDIKNVRAYISVIVVHQDHKGMGYGQQLLNATVLSLKEKKFKFLELEVKKSNSEAIKFYKKNNFNIVSTDRRLEYLMVKDISKC